MERETYQTYPKNFSKPGFGICHGKWLGIGWDGLGNVGQIWESDVWEGPHTLWVLGYGWDAFEKGFGTSLSYIFFHFLAFSQNDGFCGEFPQHGFWETLWHMYVSVWDINGVPQKGRFAKKDWQVLGAGLGLLGHVWEVVGTLLVTSLEYCSQHLGIPQKNG